LAKLSNAARSACSAPAVCARSATPTRRCTSQSRVTIVRCACSASPVAIAARMSGFVRRSDA
jgi:hypothetical protein